MKKIETPELVIEYVRLPDKVNLVNNSTKMTSYLSLVKAFAVRSSFWPPEAFTLDIRVEERIYEWCEYELKNNSDFMSLVSSDKALDMNAIYKQIQSSSDVLLANCIVHYWLMLAYRNYKEQKPMCIENADWIWNKMNFTKRMPWHKDESVTLMVNSNTMSTIKLSDIPKLTQDELKTWRQKLAIYTMESMDVESCKAANSILEEIGKYTIATEK